MSRWRSGTLKINEAVDVVAVRRTADEAKDVEARPRPKEEVDDNGPSGVAKMAKVKDKLNGEAVRTKAVDAATIEDSTADAVVLAQLTSAWR